MERKFLTSLLSNLDRKSPHWITSKWSMVIHWVLLALAFLALFALGENRIVSINTLVLFAVFIGMVFGVFFMYRQSYKCWPYLTAHLSRDSISKRLHEIE